MVCGIAIANQEQLSCDIVGTSLSPLSFADVPTHRQDDDDEEPIAL